MDSRKCEYSGALCSILQEYAGLVNQDVQEERERGFLKRSLQNTQLLGGPNVKSLDDKEDDDDEGERGSEVADCSYSQSGNTDASHHI